MARKFPADEIVFAYVAEKLREERDRGIAFRAMGERYGVSHPYIIDAINNDTGKIRKIADGYAAVHFEGSWDELRLAAQRWQDEHPERARTVAPSWMLEGLRYPRMSPALLMAFHDRVDDAFLRKFSRSSFVGADSLSAEDWWTRLKVALADELLARSAKAQRIARKATENPVPPKTLDERKKKSRE